MTGLDQFDVENGEQQSVFKIFLDQFFSVTNRMHVIHVKEGKLFELIRCKVQTQSFSEADTHWGSFGKLNKRIMKDDSLNFERGIFEEQ